MQLADVKPLAAGIHARTKKPAAECWANAVPSLSMVCTGVSWDCLKIFLKALYKVLRDEKAGRTADAIRPVVMRAQSWGFSTSGVERTQLV